MSQDPVRRRSLLVLAACIVLLVVFRLQLMTFVLEPIALLLWAAWRIVAAVDQHVYWILLVIIAAALLLRLIPSDADGAPVHPSYRASARPLSRIESWQAVLGKAHAPQSDREGLRHQLQKLGVAVVEATERHRQQDLWAKAVASDSGNLPDSLRRLFLAFDAKPGAAARLRGWLAQLLPPALRLRLAAGDNRRDFRIADEILAWMEADLEIPADRNTGGEHVD